MSILWEALEMYLLRHRLLKVSVQIPVRLWLLAFWKQDISRAAPRTPEDHFPMLSMSNSTLSNGTGLTRWTSQAFCRCAPGKSTPWYWSSFINLYKHSGSRTSFFSEDVNYMYLMWERQTRQTAGSGSQVKWMSYFGRFNYDFKEKYFSRLLSVATGPQGSVQTAAG